MFFENNTKFKTGTAIVHFYFALQHLRKSKKKKKTTAKCEMYMYILTLRLDEACECEKKKNESTTIQAITESMF